MDILFDTSVIINGQSASYNVTFANNAYHFEPQGNQNAPHFQVRREDDTWKAEGDLPNIAKQQAIAALESYLLSQH